MENASFLETVIGHTGSSPEEVSVGCECGRSIQVTGQAPHTRWFKYDRDYLCVNKSQFIPVIFEPPCISTFILDTFRT
jgi:hypothetical protein